VDGVGSSPWLKQVAPVFLNGHPPRRSSEFVARKVTRTAAAIKLGLADELRLGDLEATRDWSFAGDVVEAMWLMLQQETGDGYVIRSGVSCTVWDLVRTAFQCVDLDYESYLTVDPEFVRPPDPVPLQGDPTRARKALRCKPRTSFDEIIRLMLEADLRELSNEDARVGAGR
jgi:GDPmannose 4,6-dehydratase